MRILILLLDFDLTKLLKSWNAFKVGFLFLKISIHIILLLSFIKFMKYLAFRMDLTMKGDVNVHKIKGSICFLFAYLRVFSLIASL